MRPREVAGIYEDRLLRRWFGDQTAEAVRRMGDFPVWPSCQHARTKIFRSGRHLPRPLLDPRRMARRHASRNSTDRRRMAGVRSRNILRPQGIPRTGRAEARQLWMAQWADRRDRLWINKSPRPEPGAIRWRADRSRPVEYRHSLVNGGRSYRNPFAQAPLDSGCSSRITSLRQTGYRNSCARHAS